MTVSPALRKIEAELARLARDTDTGDELAFALGILARQVGSQAEMLERGIAQ